jgi:3-methyladenine DNA glycosylase AlkD
MKQTAVEWLLKKLTIANFEEQQIVIKQAKEMEKQQIKDAYISGMYDAHSKTSIDYYKENYETTL